MKIDKRTFVIVVVLLAIALPIIILVFHKSFFPIIISLKNSFISASLLNGTTGLPPWLRNALNLRQ